MTKASGLIKSTLVVLFCVLQVFATHAQTYQVGHITATFTDADRSNRSVPTEIYYPADMAGDNVPFSTALPGNAPCISFGHGFVMTLEAYANIRNAVVSKGYIIAFPTTEGSFSPSHAEFGKDLAFVLRKVTELGTLSSSVLYNRVHTATCVMGHSMGGGAAFLAMSSDPSIKGIVTFAAAETTPSAISAAASIAAPSLVFAGENDCVTAPATNQQPMYAALVSACKHYISIKGGSHCQMAGTSITCSFGESTCTPAPGITRATQHTKIDQYLIPWLNYTLKGNCAEGTSFESMLATDADVTSTKNCTLCSASAVPQSSGSSNVAMYPNPAGDKIIFSLPYSQAATLVLYNAIGGKVYETTTIGGTTIVNTAGFPSGMYSYCILGLQATAIRGTIVVQQ